MKKKVLVTGGAGFVGSNLVPELLKAGYEVTILDNLSTGLRLNLPKDNRVKLVAGDVRDFELVSSTVRGHKYVIHLAAQAFIPVSYDLPLQFAETNAIGSVNVFKTCLDHDVKRIVHMSSSEVYGSAQYLPMDEKHPLCPESTYAVGKAAADMWAQTFYHEHDLPVVILRPFNAFGPRDTVPRFIPEMIRQCSKQESIHVGNLDAERDFTYVKDLAFAIIAAVEKEGTEGEIINFGTNTKWKMQEILDLVRQYTDSEEKSVIVDKKRLRPKDVTALMTSNVKAGKVLEYKPTIGFKKGLQMTIDWYRESGMNWGYEIAGWRWRY